MSLLPTLPSRKILQYTKTLEQLNSGISILDGTGVQFFAGLGESTQTFTTPGTYTWTAPDGITSIEAACWGAGGGGGGGVSSYAGTYQVPFIGPQTFGSVIVSSGSRTFSTPGTYTWVCPPGVTSVDTQCWSGGGGGGGGCSDFGGNATLAFNSNQTFGTPTFPMNPSTWYSLTGPQFQTNQTGQGTIPIVPGTTELSFSIALYGQVVAGFSQRSSGSTTFLPVSGSRSDDGPFHVDMGPSGSRVWAADIANTFTIVSTAVTTVTVPAGAEYLVFADGLPFYLSTNAPITVNAIAQSASGGGGGGGGYGRITVPVTPGTAYTVQVGAGGTPGGGSYGSDNYAADGSDGGISSFTGPPGPNQVFAGAEPGLGGTAGGIGGGAYVNSVGGGVGGIGGYPLNSGDVDAIGVYGGNGANGTVGAAPVGGGGGGGATDSTRGEDASGSDAGVGGGNGDTDNFGGATNGTGSDGTQATQAGGGGGGGYADINVGHQGATGGSGQVILEWSAQAVNTQSFCSTGSGSWTCPAGVTSVTVEMWAGGGGGGGGYYTAAHQGSSGGGGGGGGYCITTIATIPGHTYNLNVGAGGIGGTGEFTSGTSTSGTSGGDSTFTFDLADNGYISATGGAGGQKGTNSVPIGATGGTGGYLTVHAGTDVGTIPTGAGYKGGNGAAGTVVAAIVTPPVWSGGPGGGGASSSVNGIQAGFAGSNGGDPTLQTPGGSSICAENSLAGGGGAGGSGSTTYAHNGTNGGNGQIILTWNAGTATTQPAVWIPLNGAGVQQANFLYNSIGAALDYSVVPGTTQLIISSSGVLNGANTDTYTWPLVAGFSTVAGSTTFLPVSGTTHVNLGPGGSGLWTADVANTFGVDDAGVTVTVPNSANYLVFAFAAPFGSTPNNTLFGDITLPSGEIIPAAGGGGGGGAYIINTIPVVAGTQYTVIVGAGGIAGIGAGGSTSYAQDGTAGGVSSFGATVAGGGSGGTSGGIGGGVQNNSTGGGVTGVGGSPSGPSTLQFAGGNGAAGPTATPALNGAGGGGGALTTATGANANGAIAGGDGGSYSPSVTAGSSDGTETSPAGGGGYGGYASDVFGATGSNGGHGQVILTWIPASLLGSYYDSDIARGFNVHLQAVSPGIFVLPAGDGPAPNYIFYEGFLLISAMLASTPAQAAAIAAQVLSQLANSGQDFTSDSTTQTNLLFGMPAGYTVIGVKVSLTTPFQIGTGSGVSLQIGTAAVPTFYAPSYELTSAPFVDISHANYNDSNPNHNTLATTFGAHDIYAVFTSTNVSISTISAGAVEIVIQYRLS